MTRSARLASAHTRPSAQAMRHGSRRAPPVRVAIAPPYPDPRFAYAGPPAGYDPSYSSYPYVYPYGYPYPYYIYYAAPWPPWPPGY